MTETPLSGDDRIPTFERLPSEIYFRHVGLQQPHEWEMHFHPWGQFNYVSHGVMYIEVAGKRFLSSRHCAVWVPPGFEHASYTSAAITYRSVYLSEQRSRRMPAEPCTLTVNAILKAILDEFARLCVRRPGSAQQERMALDAPYKQRSRRLGGGARTQGEQGLPDLAQRCRRYAEHQGGGADLEHQKSLIVVSLADIDGAHR
jgi:hypothetical protein